MWGKAPLPHNKRNCYPPYPEHYLNVKFFPHVVSKKRPSTNKNTGRPTWLLIRLYIILLPCTYTFTRVSRSFSLTSSFNRLTNSTANLDLRNSVDTISHCKRTMEVKSVGTFPVILLKLATSPLPPQTKLNLEQNGWNWVLFWATTLLGEVGGRRDEPKAEQKIVLRSRILRNYCLEGLFQA